MIIKIDFEGAIISDQSWLEVRPSEAIKWTYMYLRQKGTSKYFICTVYARKKCPPKCETQRKKIINDFGL